MLGFAIRTLDCVHSFQYLFSGLIDLVSPTARGAKWFPFGGLPSNTCILARCIAAWPNDDPLRGGPLNGHSPSVWTIVRRACLSPHYGILLLMLGLAIRTPDTTFTPPHSSLRLVLASAVWLTQCADPRLTTGE
eukprot:4215434-Heterocapsa_arctica.AAC.1